MTWSTYLPLRGAGGEPVDFLRTIHSHGVAELPPARVGESSFEVTIPTAAGPRIVGVRGAGRDRVEIVGAARRPERRVVKEIEERVAHLMRLDEDLSDFYRMVAQDPDLSWITAGAGRMMRSATVFEDVVKTICTTNCTWAATERMVGALVQHLGEPAPGAPEDTPFGRAFPTPDAMARASESFYRDVVRAGYRGAYLRALAAAQASGELDLESWGQSSKDDLRDDELAARLLVLPGVGPYAAAHIMLMLGRYSRLILDSWTRPKFLQVTGMKRAKDATIERRFRRYGDYAGLAFWLLLTRSWVPEEAPALVLGEFPGRHGLPPGTPERTAEDPS